MSLLERIPKIPSIKNKKNKKGIEKVCWCGRRFTSNNPRKKFCSVRCQNKYYNRTVKGYERQKRWRERHKTWLENWKISYKQKLQNLWGKVGYHHPSNPSVIQSELFVANEVLPKYGFDNIVLTREFSNYFPCDILCKKDGKIYLVEVTLQYARKINPRIIPLVKFLDAKVLVCHIKPDFSMYFIKEVDVERRLSSSCIEALKNLSK